jgi:hypothetical protein
VVAPSRADDAFSDDPVPRAKVVHRGADLDDLAAPLVPGDDRVRDRNDVAPLVELEVRVADADGV